MKKVLLLLGIVLFSCSENQSIVNNIEEGEANEIIVYLASKQISAQKIKASQTETAATATTTFWNISVDPDKAVEAMALLNQQGLPRRKGITLLKLFEKSGLMSSDKEETIRYQAGQQEELKSIIRKIDGVIDADVQISFPSTEVLPGATAEKPKASVYIKHQGVFEDPNNHLETKIKRLVAGAIENLDFEDVSVILDKSKLSGITLKKDVSMIGKAKDKDYVSIWSMVMTKSSAARFKFIFFFLLILILAFGGSIGFLVYKYYPKIRNKK